MASSGAIRVTGEGGKRRDGHERPGAHRLAGPIGPVPGSGPQPAADCQRPGTPGQLRTYKLVIPGLAAPDPFP